MAETSAHDIPTAQTRSDEAKAILVDNDKGSYTVPSPKLYPFQWNWDSAFVALGLATLDRGRAWEELETLAGAQWPSGMIPHIIFHEPQTTYFPGPDVWQGNNGPIPSSGISQPPVFATVVRRLLESSESTAERDRAANLYEPLARWHRWWHEARDPEGRGVLAIAHPWESGRDNLPDWDEPSAAIDTSKVGTYERRDVEVVDPGMRPHKSDYDAYIALVQFGAAHDWDHTAIAQSNPFWVADPAMTAIFLRAERDLAWLGRHLGRDVSEFGERIERLEAGFEQFWNSEAKTYCSIDLRTGRQAVAGTSASFLAPYAGVIAHVDELVVELVAWSEHCQFLVPSFDPRHDGFEPNRYWRGPVWLMVNYMIAVGFAEVGETELADRIKRSTHDLIIATGFPESFNPLDGEAVGGPFFSWTAAMWLAWAGKAEQS